MGAGVIPRFVTWIVGWPLDVPGHDRAEFDRAVEAYGRLIDTLHRDDAVLDSIQSRSALLAIWAVISGGLAWFVTQPPLKSSP